MGQSTATTQIDMQHQVNGRFSAEVLASLRNQIDTIVSRRDNSVMMQRIKVPGDAWTKAIYDPVLVRKARDAIRCAEATAESEFEGEDVGMTTTHHPMSQSGVPPPPSPDSTTESATLPLWIRNMSVCWSSVPASSRARASDDLLYATDSTLVVILRACGHVILSRKLRGLGDGSGTGARCPMCRTRIEANKDDRDVCVLPSADVSGETQEVTEQDGGDGKTSEQDGTDTA